MVSSSGNRLKIKDPVLFYRESVFSDKKQVIDLVEWNKLLRQFSIGEELPLRDLRSISTEELTKNLFPVIDRPDKGVTLEYDLRLHSELYSKCVQLWSGYSDLRLGARYVGQPVSYIGYHPKEEITSSTIDGGISAGKGYVEVQTTNVKAVFDECLRREELALEKRKFLYEKKKEKGNSTQAENGEEDGDSLETKKLELIKTIEEAYSELLEKDILTAHGIIAVMKTTTAEYIQNYRNKIEGESEPNSITFLESMLGGLKPLTSLASTSTTTGTASTNLFIIRLFPAYGALQYGGPNISTTRLSHSRFIQTKVPVTNLQVMLSGNIALDSLDTQWYDFYMQLFYNIIDYGNPPCTIRVSTERINNCYLMEPFSAVQDWSSAKSFNLNFLSSSVGYDVDHST